ncbi:MAG: TIGR00341 family protein [Magnetococcales bacterium]|nr:TIGR00341 family protein [Magnetococcales bacterium]
MAQEHTCVFDHFIAPEMEDQRNAHFFLVTVAGRQRFLDELHTLFEKSDTARITIFDAESTFPDPHPVEEGGQTASDDPITTREALYAQVASGAKLSGNFLLLTLLSSIVAGIGLLEDSVAVVIGAMVIAPLLGPNLAFSLGAALGDRRLMWRAIQANLAGLSLTLLLGVLAGYLLEPDLSSRELMARTHVGLDGMALALASGIAAVLSLTAGLSSTLVGVMVAVALLPPAITVGLMLGSGKLSLAMGAVLLLLVNVVSVNLSAQLVFFAKGIKPRTWLEQKSARQSIAINLAVWTLLLIALFLALYYGWKPL